MADVFGDDPNDELDVDPEALIIGANPEDDFGEVDDEPPAEEEHKDDDHEQEPDRDAMSAQAERAERVAKAEDVARQWEAEQARRKAAYDEAEAAVIKLESDIESGAIEPDAKAKVAAYNRMSDARRAAEEAHQRTEQAVNYAREVATAPQNVAADAWIAKNPRFRSDQKFAEEALAVARRLEADGMNPGHPKFYEALDRQLKRTPPMNRNGRTSGAPVTAGAQSRGNDQPRLTETDKQQLRDWGLVKPGMSKEKRIAVAKEYLRQKTISNSERRAG